MELKVVLLSGWRQVQNAGPITYMRGSSSAALQFSFAQYKPGRLANVNGDMLIGTCERLTAKVKGRKETSRQTGICPFGMYGTLVVKGAYPRHFQAWVLSNHREFILITHIDEQREPDDAEIVEANDIALKTMVG